MQPFFPTNSLHPTGEQKKHATKHPQDILKPIKLELNDGLPPLFFRFDPKAKISGLGLFPLFAQFLSVSGSFQRLVETCPITYKSHNAPNVRDVLGTLLISIVAGHTRYTHIDRLAQDPVLIHSLGLTRLVSADSLRRFFLDPQLSLEKNRNLDPQYIAAVKKNNIISLHHTTTINWLKDNLLASVLPALSLPWIMDIDTTIKTLYGRQEKAQIAYNPHKPGRPSHSYHFCFIAELKLVLDVNVSPGKESHPIHQYQNILSLIKKLTLEQRPQFIRGDIAYGNDHFMTLLESPEIEQKYLFRLKKTTTIEKEILHTHKTKAWQPIAPGKSAIKTKIKLSGWEKERTIILIRQEKATRPPTPTPEQPEITALTEIIQDSQNPLYEYHAIVTNIESLDHQPLELSTYDQWYRQRATIENSFDELKNQWGLSGYTSANFERNQVMALYISHVYNLWNQRIRSEAPSNTAEAISTRPSHLEGVAHLSDHGRQKHISVTLQHNRARTIMESSRSYAQYLNQINSKATQLERVITLWSRILSKYHHHPRIESG
jgi:Transposase DDE domain group 1